MTVAAIALPKTYNEDGVSTVFTVPFQFILPTDLVVERFDPAGARSLQVLGTDYTVAGGGGSPSIATGSITTMVAKPAGWDIRISRFTPRTQPANYTPGDTFPAESHEHALDREMLVIQEVEAGAADNFAHSLRFPEPVPMMIGAAGRANMLQGYDGAGDPIPRDEGDLAKGDPGGNVMTIGLFNQAPALSIPVGADLVQTSGWSVIGEGTATYVYDPLVDAAFAAANPRTAFVSANGRGYRLDPQQLLTIQKFGGRADGECPPASGPVLGAFGATDNTPALLAAIAFVTANSIVIGANNYYRGGAHIRFPAANGVYDFQSAVEVRHSCRISGDGLGGNGGWPSILRWRPGMHGVVMHHFGSDLAGPTVPAIWSSAGSVIEGLVLVQHKTGNLYDVDNFHGIFMRVPLTIRDCTIIGWSGAGVYGLGGVPDTNANHAYLERVICQGNEHGVHVDGGDANVITGVSLDTQTNRGYGIFDSSFLGNTWIGCHADGNGTAHSASGTTIGSICSFGGNRYYVRAGMAAGASANAPTGAATSNAWWGWISAGAADANFKAWVGGMTWREGGAYRNDSLGNARSLFIGCYAEFNGASYFVHPTLVIGGVSGSPIENNGATVIGNVLGNMTVTGGIDISNGVYNVNSQQVVGARLAALPVDATDLPTALTLVNAIKARLKATGGHGLVAD